MNWVIWLIPAFWYKAVINTQQSKYVVWILMSVEESWITSLYHCKVFTIRFAANSFLCSCDRQTAVSKNIILGQCSVKEDSWSEELVVILLYYRLQAFFMECGSHPSLVLFQNLSLKKRCFVCPSVQHLTLVVCYSVGEKTALFRIRGFEQAPPSYLWTLKFGAPEF